MVEASLSEEIAFQIRATRDAQEMTQSALAQAAGMTQNNLSRLENPEYGKHNISSLKRIAAALDVAVIVRLVPFSQYIDWLSGTPRIDRGLSRHSLAVVPFDKDAGLKDTAGKLIPFPGAEEPKKINEIDSTGALAGGRRKDAGMEWQQGFEVSHQNMGGVPA